jgi:hypothetical protein
MTMKFKIASLFLCGAGLFYTAFCGVGESAVITLVFPPGARATGLGETFTAIADDANATYFNPAGLGQPPLANSWHYYLDNKGYTFTAISSKRKKAFDINEKIWVGTNKGLVRFNGKVWETYDTYVIEKDESLGDIVRKFIEVGDDNTALVSAELALMRENKLGMARYNALSALLKTQLSDSVKKQINLDEFAFQFVSLPLEERTSEKIYGLIAGKVDSLKADKVTKDISGILAGKDKEFSDLVELRIPFSLAVRDSVTTLTVDESDQLWVGLTTGLWRYDGSSWKSFSILDGLPSNSINTVVASSDGRIGVGTDRGCAIFSDGAWKKYGVESGLPDSMVTAIAFNKTNGIYVGTPSGLAFAKDTTWTLFDTTHGLLSQSVSALLFDSRQKLWIDGANGVTVYDEVSWKRYRLPDCQVYSFAEYAPGRLWIGTSRGAITYKAGKTRVDANGKTVEDPPTWKPFHSKNALKGDQAYSMNVYGKDVWLVTEKAVNHFDKAQKEVLVFWEPLLPALGLRDLWHTYASVIIPTEDWGTFGGSINFINMGVNEWSDELGRSMGRARSFETVFGLSYGLGLIEDLSVGMNAKFAWSVLAPVGPSNEGTGTTFAIDAAILKRNLLLNNLDLGFMAQNMGPPIFYVTQDNMDPIPFTLRLGLAYRAYQSPIHDLKFALDLDREFVKNLDSGKPEPFYKALFISMNDEPWQVEVQQINIHLGMEYWYVNFIALRTGFLFDYIGERYELNFGLGLRYGNMNFDWSYIHSPEGFLKGFLQSINKDKTGATGVRHGQWRVSLITKF